MKIDFENMEQTELKNFRGGEKTTIARMFVDDNNKIMHGKLEPGASIGMHTHEDGSEVIYILSGEGKVLYDDGEERLWQGACHYCPKGHRHSLINDSAGDMVFFAVVPRQ